MYDQSVGSFTTEDPARMDGNYYSYCGGNPVSRWDPSGLCWIFNTPNGTLRDGRGSYAFDPESGFLRYSSWTSWHSCDEYYIQNCEGGQIYVNKGYGYTSTVFLCDKEKKKRGEREAARVAAEHKTTDIVIKPYYITTANTAEIAVFESLPLAYRMYVLETLFIIKNTVDNYLSAFYHVDPAASDGQIANSFRHVYLNSMMTYHFGASLADRIASAHEAISIYNTDDAGNGYTHHENSVMDLYNNHVGRQIGTMYLRTMGNHLNFFGLGMDIPAIGFTPFIYYQLALLSKRAADVGLTYYLVKG